MRYLCACPSCGFRLTRKYFLRLQDPLRMECPGCHKRLRSVRHLDYLWALVFVIPFGFVFYMALESRITWWAVPVTLLAIFGLMYVYFPYVTKMTLDETPQTDISKPAA